MAKSDEIATGPDAELEAMALGIYTEMIRRGNPDGYVMENVALKAFQRATAFRDVARAIRSGELSCAIPAEPKPRLVDVPQFDLGDKDVWHPRIDERNGQRVVFQELVDPYSFAPNLPLEHPCNVRSGQRLKALPDGKVVVALN